MKWIVCLIFIITGFIVHAEGTKELAPNASIIVEGRNTSDITALHIGNYDYANFANFRDPEADARLYIKVLDPTTECMMLGFSPGQENDGTALRYRFYVKDPNGNVIFASDEIGNNNAQIDNWDEAIAGPEALVGPTGYDQITITSVELTQNGWIGEGDYYVEFEFNRGFDRAGLLIPLWDINVIDCATSPNQAKTGRVWSEQWSLFTPSVIRDNFARPFNGSFYIVAPDDNDPGAGFVTKMIFDGSQFRAAAFTVALNSFGASADGTLVTNRRSVYRENTIIGEYPVFLNDPIDIYSTAELGSLQILGTEGCLPGNYCFRAISSEIGEIEILIDLDGQDGLYTANSADILVGYRVDANQVDREFCIPWDGYDGLGNEYEGFDFDSFTVITSFRQGIYHFPVFDVEINENGFRLEAVRPLGLSPKLYYDDTNIPFNSNTGSPNRNLQGCETPCHTWFGNTGGRAYGNDNTINSWWYARTLIDEAKVILKFNKSLDTDISFCEGTFAQVGDSVINTAGLHVFTYPTFAGCDSVVIIAAHEVNFSSAIVPEADVINCYLPEIELNGAFSSPFNGISFLWTVPDSQEITDLTAPIISINTPGIYTLTITENTVGCNDVSEVEIAEDLVLPIIEIQDDVVLFCDQAGKELNASVEDASNYVAFWNTSDGNIISGADDLSPIIDRPGSYTLTVQNTDNGCFSTADQLITRDTLTYLTVDVDNEIRADFCEAVNLSINLNSAFYESIKWSPAEELSCDDCTSPEFFVGRDQQFNVLVRDTNGCVAQATIDVLTNEDYRLFIPNAFSPNNDGINERFNIFSATCAVDVVSFSIFDRWGNRVFERTEFKSTDTDMSWDGWFNEKLMNAGTYVYQASIRTFRDEVIQLQGDLELIR